MNFLPKGSLTVVMATIVASLLILFSGNTVADSTEPLHDDVVLQAKAGAIEIKRKGVPDNTATSVAQVVSPPPPPGPFVLKKPAAISELELAVPLNAKSAPKLEKPELRRPEKLEEIVFKKMQPSMPIEPAKIAAQPTLLEKEIVMKRVELKEPKLLKSELVSPVTPEKISDVTSKVAKPVLVTKIPVPTQIERTVVTPPRPTNVRKQPSEPIWAMKPPISPDAQMTAGMPQQHSVKQPAMPAWPKNMVWAPRANQQYMYIPMPVYPQIFAYPQMPMNGYSFPGRSFKPQFNSVRQGAPVKALDINSTKPLEKVK